MIVVLAGLGAIVGGLWGWHRDANHQATAVILVNPLEGSPFSPNGQGDDLVNLETEAQLVTSNSVSGLVAKRLEISGPVAAVRAGVTVEVPTNTQLLRIRVTDPSAEAAALRAQAFAETYLDFRRARTESLLFDRNARINEQLRQLAAQRDQLSQRLSTARPGSPRAALLQQQVAELTERTGVLHTQLVTSQSSSTDPGQVVTPATEDARGLVSGPIQFGAIGALGAALVGAFLLIGRGARNQTIRHPAELEQAGVPILARTDQIERARASILAATERRPLAVLLATSTPLAPRSEAAFELGVAFGRAKLETILVEMVEFVPGSEQRAGLTDVLLGKLTADEALMPLMAHMQVLSAGDDCDRLDDLVAGLEMSETLTELQKRADVVVVAAGPLSDARTQAVARLCDVTVLEVAEGRTLLTDVEQSISGLEQCGGSLAGLLYVPSTARPRRGWRARRG